MSSYIKEMMEMTENIIITLAPKAFARKGYKFVFEGKVSEECKECPLYNVCIKNLEVGRVYEIVNVRNKKHKCKVYGSEIVVVEVKEADIEALVKTSMAIEGAIISYSPVNCNEYSCPYFKLCKPLGVKPGDKYKIIRVLEKLKCSRGYSLTKVLLRRVRGF